MPHEGPRARDGRLVGPALREAKFALREHVLAAVDAIPAATREGAAQSIAARIAALPSFVASKHVLLTLPFRHEWQTRPLFAAARAAGKRVALPRVDTRRRILELCEVADLGADVAPGFHGIDEPLAHCALVPAAAIDWVLVPGVAFDAGLRRLGYGGGFYDRLLPSLSAAARVSGAFDAQIVECVPHAPHDLGVDVVVTESRMFPR